MNRPQQTLTRRDFLQVTALAGTAAAVSGCITNPVTGQSQLMLVSQQQERAIDREASPKQFSSDYGVVQDPPLVAYVGSVGRKLVAVSHRPDVPYSFTPVNAVYANAYAFPGGTIAVTRGMLIELEDEAQLAALLGHELAHVNYRHTGQQMSRGMLLEMALAGAGAYLATERPGYADIVSGLGGLGGTMFLAKYSRDHERQADATGMDYMVKAGYDPKGMVDLTSVLVRMAEGRRAGAIATLFSTHPMSDERLRAAAHRADMNYAPGTATARNRDAFRDATASLRAKADAIRAFQAGQEALAKKDLTTARARLTEGLAAAPEDYAGLLLLGRVAAAQGRHGEAEQLARRAAAIYPNEAQARSVMAQSLYGQGRYDDALESLALYNRLLPGDPMVPFYAGLCHERAGRREPAARAYASFLRSTSGAADQSSPTIRHAASRLNAWGYRGP